MKKAVLLSLILVPLLPAADAMENMTALEAVASRVQAMQSTVEEAPINSSLQEDNTRRNQAVNASQEVTELSDRIGKCLVL